MNIGTSLFSMQLDFDEWVGLRCG